MKTMILVKGAAEKGKSQSIKRVAMTMPFSSIIKPWLGDDYDSYIIGTVTDKDGNERIVGIESQGDPNSNQKEWIEECVKANFISDCLAAKTAQNKEKGAEKWHKVCT